ncbi:DMT family transporter [Chlamydia sp. 17-3921]|uniref:DMT family transporter n=1 Tax=Chlamydia sp. 17-3921 TaxID=2675798 RepID=UPI00191AADB1|nr:DMT family transporter [Chlamydia sp. 17-3921]
MFSNQHQITSTRNKSQGIFYGLVSCFYWGIVFVIPSLLQSFGDLDIVLTRYTIFGIFSLITCLTSNPQLLRETPLKLWRTITLWSLLINPVYYLGITLGIRYVGSALTVMIAGLAPIAVLCLSNIRQKELSWILLFIISCITFIGVVLTHISDIHTSTTTIPPLQYIFGIVSAVVSTGLWVIYVIYNQKLLENNPKLSPQDLCHLLGITTLIICLPLIIVLDTCRVTHIIPILVSHTPMSQRLLFFGLCVTMGIFSSAQAITSWNKASLRLSPALLGTMLIFEPIFGLILSYLYSQSLPKILESIGIFLMLGGSLLSLILFGRKINKSQEEAI